jgi:hypothetical protein
MINQRKTSVKIPKNHQSSPCQSQYLEYGTLFPSVTPLSSVHEMILCNWSRNFASVKVQEGLLPPLNHIYLFHASSGELSITTSNCLMSSQELICTLARKFIIYSFKQYCVWINEYTEAMSSHESSHKIIKPRNVISSSHRSKYEDSCLRFPHSIDVSASLSCHFSPENGDSRLLRNAVIDLRIHTAPKPKTTPARLLRCFVM